MKTLKHYLWISLILLMASPSVVLASLVPGTDANYGEFSGTSILYSNVFENTSYGAYNAPTIGGDTLSFVPSGLAAESIGGLHPIYNIPIPVVNDAQLGFHVYANAENYIERLDFSEGGDFAVQGSGTTNTYVDVTANFFVNIYEVDGESINTISKTFSITNFSPNADGTYDLTDGSGTGILWDGSVNIDLEQMLIDEGISFSSGVTHASVNLDNWLTAESEAGTYARIQKKEAGAFTVTAVVPEPASLVLIMGTTSLLGFIRRRFIA